MILFWFCLVNSSSSPEVRQDYQNGGEFILKKVSIILDSLLQSLPGGLGKFGPVSLGGVMLEL